MVVTEWARENCFLIVISGPTCSGKTFVSGKLKQRFSEEYPSLKVKVFHLDDYYYEENEEGNYDWPRAFDISKLCYEILVAQETNDVIIMEGIFIGYVQLEWDYVIHLQASVETIVERRIKRFKELSAKGDPSVAGFDDSEEMLIYQILPAYERWFKDEHFEECSHIKEFTSSEGADFETLFQDICSSKQ
ncbi:hypothetical protein PCE1_001992 [Barthelona sp. PCE]